MKLLVQECIDVTHNRPVFLQKPGDITLIRLQLLHSARSVGQDVECEDDVLRSPEFAQPDFFAVLIGQREVRGKVAHFERR